VSKVQLKPVLASLFKVDVSDIELQTADGGLTHQTCICQVSGQRYFVKIYQQAGSFSFAVGKINQLTTLMRNRGVPAPRVVLYSPEYANVVVHEFVEGKFVNGDFSQIRAIARLYSQVALIGAEHSRSLSKPEYLAEISTYSRALDNIKVTDAKVDILIHAGILGLAENVLAFLQDTLPDNGLFHIYMHDDFTEKNILMEGCRVKLLCDWDSYRLKLFAEHIACTACRFATDRPLAGVLQEEKLALFLQSLDPRVMGFISSSEEFARLFPLLATLKHLRTYHFRNSVVHQGRNDLRKPLLEWPLQHCLWLMDNRQRVSDWVRKAIVKSAPEALLEV